MTYREAMLRARRAYWRTALKECGGNVTRLASHAGMNRTATYDSLRRAGVELPADSPTRKHAGRAIHA